MLTYEAKLVFVQNSFGGRMQITAISNLLRHRRQVEHKVNVSRMIVDDIDMVIGRILKANDTPSTQLVDDRANNYCELLLAQGRLAEVDDQLAFFGKDAITFTKDCLDITSYAASPDGLVYPENAQHMMSDTLDLWFAKLATKMPLDRLYSNDAPLVA